MINHEHLRVFVRHSIERGREERRGFLQAEDVANYFMVPAESEDKYALTHQLSKMQWKMLDEEAAEEKGFDKGVAGVCPICGDEVEYQAIGTKPTKGVAWFSTNCLCGFHGVEKFEFKMATFKAYTTGGAES